VNNLLSHGIFYSFLISCYHFFAIFANEMNGSHNIYQYEVIRQLRLPMIVLVTFAHSYGGVEEGFSLLTSEWNTYEFLRLLISQTLVKVAMPVFFIMSGYLFFANVDVWNFKVYKTKIWRRIKTLLIPYLIWNLLMAIKLKTFSWSMFWAYWEPAGVQIDWFGQEQLMTAPANMPLWFLRDLMVVSLLTPIIYIILRKLGLWLMGLLTVLYLSGIYAFIPGLSAYAVYFFTFGAFLSIRKMDLVASLKRVEIPAYVLSVLFAISMLLSYNTSVFSSLMLCFRLTGAIAVFCIASRFLSSADRRLPSLVCDSAYFIYLAHYVFFFSFIDTVFFAIFATSIPALSLHYLLVPFFKVAILSTIYIFYNQLKRTLV
jgi:surface polysaccharide O-acyltransferase-like enzyme